MGRLKKRKKWEKREKHYINGFVLQEEGESKRR